jgi:hypothetical protein
LPLEVHEIAPIDDIHELLPVIELEDVIVREERARRVKPIADDTEDGSEIRTTNALGIIDLESDEALGVAFRYRTVFNDGHGAEFVADMEARYRFLEPRTVSDAVKQEFATRVAFMTVYPYLRSSIQGSATRLGVKAPVLGMVRQGDMTISGTLSQDEEDDMFRDDSPEL